MKTYRGIREPACFVVVFDDRAAPSPAPAAGEDPPAVVPAPTPAPPRELIVPRELLTKPAAPFDWGSGAETAGTHYLAIALLADLLGPADRAAIKALLPAMRRFLARLPQEGFEISDTVFHALLYAVGAAPRAESPAPAAQPGTQAGERRTGGEGKPPPLPGTEGEGRGERQVV